jgi:guanine deaminase
MTPTVPHRLVLSGALLHCTGPVDAPVAHYHREGLLIADEGYIVAAGDRHALRDRLTPADNPVDIDGLIVPGFIDCHVHYPQFDIIGQHGKSLLDWLDHYTFPAELAFADASHAQQTAERFLDAALGCGTTTAMVYGTVHAHSVDAFLTAAGHRGLRMICGKALMDRHAPQHLMDPPGGGIDAVAAHIGRWHGKGRLGTAITPRFAPGCTDAQMRAAGALASAYPDVHLQTHLAETRREVDWVREIFPDAPHYSGVYDQFGLLGRRTLLGHGIHLGDAEWRLIADRGARIVHCPSSNFFLGSGLFDMARARLEGVVVGLGSDVGAGTSLSMLDTAGDAYRVSALLDQPLQPLDLFRLITLGGAEALSLETHLGNFLPGKEADVCVIRRADLPIDLPSTAGEALDALFHLAITHRGRDALEAVYAFGHKVWTRESSRPPAHCVSLG